MPTGDREKDGQHQTSRAAPPGPGARLTAAAASRPGITLLATCLGLFLGQVDTTAINLALPAIHRDLSGGISSMQWVVDAYNVTFAALLLTGGTLGDRFGRRRLFRIGVTVFVLGSLLCALAVNLPMLLAGRVMQGMGSGMMLPQSLAILATAFPERRERNRAMAAWSIVAGSGLAAGPTLGGLLVQTLGWNSIFWVNLPIGLTALVLSFRHVPESRNPQARSLDLPGQLLAAVTLGLLTFIAVDGHNLGWLSVSTLLCAAVCVACLLGFLWTESRSPSPMVPLHLIRRGQLPVASIVAMCMTFGMYGLFMLISLAFQQERGTSALVAGLEMLPLPVVFTLLSPTVGKMVNRHGPRLPMTAGMLLMGLGLLIYAVVGADANLAVIELAFVIVGIGLALNTGPVVGVAVSAVPGELAGLASGIANLSRMLGATLGVAVQGTVLAIVGHNASHGPEFVHGLRVAILVGCAAEFLGAVVAFYGVNRTKGSAAEPAAPAASPTVSRPTGALKESPAK